MPNTNKISNLKKDPDDWVSGDEPITDAQKSYLKTLSEQIGEAFDPKEKISKSEAAKRIEKLREKINKAS